MKNKTDLPKAGAIAIAGIWVTAAAASVLSASHGAGYDVLDKIADSTSVGVSLEEKISDRIDASPSDMTYYLKRLDTLMCDYRAEEVTEVIGAARLKSLTDYRKPVTLVMSSSQKKY